MNVPLSLEVLRLQLFRVMDLARGRYSINKSTFYSLHVLQGLKNNAKKECKNTYFVSLSF
jgi:hypothetical protein